ncbi:hypothetical protein [Angustibacter sp. Root456]|uniref:hypothetical protein n=1 Tax=Angustibacter sp. Root456 TaxID=1736539 RepID=UPI000AC1F0E7|nr:hypothetical protein [Angustibacter sp. Root456]
MLSTAVSRGGVAAAAWALLVAAAAVPLAVLGGWAPWPAAVVLVVAGVVAVVVSRWVPVVPVPRAAGLLLVLVAVGAGVWAGATHAEHVVLRRDAGTYALSGQHLATAHQVRVDVHAADIGGPALLSRPGVTVGSPGFYEQGRGADVHVVPQFLLATTVWLSVGWWLGGWTGLLLVPAVVLGAAVLAFAGLAVRVVGPWWAVPATATLAVAAPVLHAGRATYSEPLALLAGCAAGALLVAVCGSRGEPPRRLAVLAGALAGGVALVRVDALRESSLLLPTLALLAVAGGPAVRRVVGPVLLGLLGATVVAAASAGLTSRPYLASLAGSLVPLAAGAVVLALGSVSAVLLARRGVRLPHALRSRLPLLLSLAVVVAGLALATRPWWQTVRQSAADPGARVVAGLQLRQGLAVDGGRTYAEHSVQWVGWWVGVPALVLALAGAGYAAWRLGRAWRDGDPLPAWTPVAVVAVGSTLLTLYRPGITPDHPWADRRLVPVVLPAVVLLAVAAVAAATRLTRRRRPGPASRLVAAAGAVLVLAPTAWATAPVATQRTERGEVAAVQRACAAFGPADSAILLDSRAANEWTQVLRGVCSVPTVVVRATSATPADRATVLALAQAIARTGRRPVLVAAESPDAVRRVGAEPTHVVHLATIEDQRLLTRRPDGAAALGVDLWLAPAT